MRLSLFPFLILGSLSLMACSTEQRFRGVPAETWQQLTGEQKQLIVDRAYQDEMVEA